MTNSQFTALLQRTAAALTKHRRLLIAAQDEYQRRYGALPGDHDNDAWVDSLEGGCGEGTDKVTAKMVNQWAVECGCESWQNAEVSHRDRERQPAAAQSSDQP